MEGLKNKQKRHDIGDNEKGLVNQSLFFRIKIIVKHLKCLMNIFTHILGDI
jgi:hypothetical protein